jgi:hypothetical protein
VATQSGKSDHVDLTAPDCHPGYAALSRRLRDVAAARLPEPKRPVSRPMSVYRVIFNTIRASAANP